MYPKAVALFLSIGKKNPFNAFIIYLGRVATVCVRGQCEHILIPTIVVFYSSQTDFPKSPLWAIYVPAILTFKCKHIRTWLPQV